MLRPANAFSIAAQRQAGIRFDPYGNYNFHVEIEGIIVGGFSEVSGLTIETEVESVHEGGVNGFEYKFPKATKQSDIVLKRGLSDFDLLWQWYQNIVNGNVDRRDGSIFLLDARGLPVMWWNIYSAFPIRWEGPTFDASGAGVAFESLTIAHHGFSKPLASLGLSAVRGAASVAGLL